MSSSKKTKVKVELTRRDFLTVAGAAVGSALAAQAAHHRRRSRLSPSLKQEQLARA